MFKQITIGLALVATSFGFGQVGIGTETPHASADLELGASNKALYLNRVPDTTVVSNPQPGMVIYDLSEHCVKVYQGSPAAWSDCLGGTGSPVLAPRNVKVGYTTGGYNIANGHPAFRSQLENTANYGASGTFKGIDGFDFTDAWADVTNVSFTPAALKAKYDIIVTGYANDGFMTAALATKLKEYVDLGGVLIVPLDFTVGSSLNIAFGGSGNVGAAGSVDGYARTLHNSITDGVFGTGGGITLLGMQNSANPSVADLPAGANILGYTNVPNTAAGTGTNYAAAWTTGAQGRAIFIYDEGIFRSFWTLDSNAYYVNGTVIDTPQERFIHNLMSYALQKVGFSAN